MISAVLVGGAVATYQAAKHHRKRIDEEFLGKNAVRPSAEEWTQIRMLARFVDKIYSRDMHRRQTRSTNANVAGVAHHGEVSEDEERKVGIAHQYEFGDQSHRPRLIIAARGTIPSSQDILDDIRVGFHSLRTSPRYQEAEKLIVSLVRQHREKYGGHDPLDIWITGHSLGADIALTAGMSLATDPKEPAKVSICCFNGPLLTALSVIETLFLIKKIKHTTLTVMDMLGEISKSIKSVSNECLQLIDSLKVELAYFLDPEELLKQLEQYEALQMGPVWMCVNKGDKICKEFFHFYRRNHEQEGLHLSGQNFFSKFLGMKHEPEYFGMPRSVTMYLNEELSERKIHLKKWTEAHRMKQWSSDNLVMKKIEFKLGEPTVRLSFKDGHESY